MMMTLHSDFLERKKEVQEYLDFLNALDNFLQNTSFHTKLLVSPIQQKTLYSAVYLLLYNIIESTVSRCIVHLERHLDKVPAKCLLNLHHNLQKEWLKSVAMTHHPSATEDTRLEAVIKLSQRFCKPDGTLSFTYLKHGGGSWDDEKIEKLTERIGISFRVPLDLYSKIKVPSFNNKKGLQLVKETRNELAHGEMSFSECGERLSAKEFQPLADAVFEYLQALNDHFEIYIEELKKCTT
jgi:hypothetical protein